MKVHSGKDMECAAGIGDQHLQAFLQLNDSLRLAIWAVEYIEDEGKHCRRTIGADGPPIIDVLKMVLREINTPPPLPKQRGATAEQLEWRKKKFGGGK